MVKWKNKHNWISSERDKLLHKIQSREISIARKELNKKINENYARSKLKEKKLFNTQESKNPKPMSEWLKKEITQKKSDDVRNFTIRKQEVKEEAKSKEGGFFHRAVNELRGSFDFSKNEESKDNGKNFFEERKRGEPKLKVVPKTLEGEEAKEEESKEGEEHEHDSRTQRLELSKVQGSSWKNVKFLKEVEDMRREVAKAVIGQDELVIDILRAIFADGHVLIEGVPGVAKTLLIRAIAESVGCKFSRIQFTVDLLPTDITGITTYTPGKGFETIKGPIFTNFVIADEINRAPPKTQSALLEAMGERQVTIGKETFKLTPPFFVMANNNPIESSGTYKLPEAQMDRFLFKLNMGYPTPEQEQKIIDTNIALHKFEDFKIKKVLSPQKIFELQRKTKEIQASPQIKKYIVDITQATRKPKEYDLKLGKYIEWGGSPRASIALYIGAKADAMMIGQKSITPQNVKNVAHIALRHRILLNYSGQAENINTDHIIDEILSKVQIP